MKLVSWNVNGFRAILKKNFLDFFKEIDADIFCIQETKMQPDQVELELPGYYQYFNSAVRKGYSGVACFTKIKPKNVFYGINDSLHLDEGRVITLEYADFYVVCAYVVNSQPKLKRLEYRLEFEDDMRAYLNKLNDKKPVIYCGDLNVAHTEIDLANPQANRNNPGFSDAERAKFTELLESGFIDTYRHFNPYTINKYTWWSYRANARANNVGWRIDYFIVSEDLIESVQESNIHDEILGSDHCPISLRLHSDHLEY